MATKKITISNQDLLTKADASSLKTSSTAGENTITAYSISKFAVNQILLFGEFGKEGSEIIKTHASTAPTGNTVTLASNLSKSHPQDTKVSILPFDQLEIYTAATTSGSKTLVTTLDIDEESEDTTYTGSAVSGYYFVRWHNSIDNTNGDYSDPIPYSGFGSNTVSSIIDIALSETNKSISEKLTYQMLLSEVNACLRYIRGKLKRWSNVQEFDYEVNAATILDDSTWVLPTTYYDKNSNRSCLAFWIEGEDNLIYVDKSEFDDLDRDTESGTPKYFTIYDGSVHITPAIGADFVAKKVYMDFYTDIVEVDSDADEITLARFDMIKHWLKWSIRTVTEHNGKPDLQDSDWLLFNSILSDAVRRESSAQKYKTTPFINGIHYRGTAGNFDTD